MKFGINTLLWTAGFDTSHLWLLPKVKAWGFDGIEVARFDFHGFPAAEIRRAAESEGLGISFCSALTGTRSVISEDAAVRQDALDFLRHGIATAAEIGSKVFVGPFCAPVGQLLGRRRTDEEWKRAVEGLQALVPDLKSAGVTLAVEPLNRFETYFLNLAADGARLCDEVGDPHVGILYDTFHANIEEKLQGPSIASVGPHLAHFHACENDRGVPGSGHVEWASAFEELKKRKYDGWVVIESFGSRIPEIAAAACIWRDLAAHVDDIPAEGVQFLKKGLA